jgi:branched-subunit amino acid permease
MGLSTVLLILVILIACLMLAMAALRATASFIGELRTRLNLPSGSHTVEVVRRTQPP